MDFKLCERSDDVLRMLTTLAIGSICGLRGVPPGAVDQLIEEHLADRTGLRLMRVAPSWHSTTVPNCIERVLAAMRAVIQAEFPLLYDGVDFSYWRADPLSRNRARVELERMVHRFPKLLPSWAERVLMLVAEKSLSAAHDLGAEETAAAQLSLMIQPAGLVMFFDLPRGATAAERTVAVAVLEWCARHANAAVVGLLPDDWPSDAENARWLEFRPAIRYEPVEDAPPAGAAPAGGRVSPDLAISRARGKPHGMSEVEQRIYALLQADAELAELFECNQLVESCRGYQARVDLLWAAGRLVVELDGHSDHSTATAFEKDRHRDYELLLSGYQVLRVTNAEILRDSMAALEKIRDVVRYLRMRQKPSI